MKKTNNQETKLKKKEIVQNLYLLATLIAMVMLLCLWLIYSAYTSVPGIYYIREVMLAVIVLTFAFSVFLLIYKKKLWNEYMLLFTGSSAFFGIVSILIRFGPNTVRCIYLAVILTALLIISEYIAIFSFASKKKKQM